MFGAACTNPPVQIHPLSHNVSPLLHSHTAQKVPVWPMKQFINHPALDHRFSTGTRSKERAERAVSTVSPRL